MAVFGLKPFLTNYYYQMQFEKMCSDPAVRARFDDYVKHRDFAGNMKNWIEVDKLMDVDTSTTPPTYTPKANIVDAELDDNDIGKLYDMFQEAFESMDADRNTVKYNKPAENFLNQWFGPNKLFSLTTATPAEEDGIRELLTLLNNNSLLVKHITKQQIPGLEKEEDVRAFMAKLDTHVKKYDTDGQLQQTIISVRDSLLEVLSYQTFQIKSAEYIAIDNASTKLKNIEFEHRNKAGQLTIFKGEYKNLLNSLFNSYKIREGFKPYGSKITRYIDGAQEHIPYDKENEKEYIPPKYEDTLSLTERIEKWTKDTYSDYFEKYVRLRGDRLFFSEHTKNIFKAIDKEKIKPQDGLTVILDKADAIKKRIIVNSKNAADHFDWFIKTMNEIKNDKPKAIEGAFKNGAKMLSLVSEIIMRAVKSGNPTDIEKAKSSMELLASMQYGLTTSKTMGALKKEKFTIFSNGNLSWNKNSQGIAMVSKALDEALLVAGLAAGYGVVMVVNRLRLRGITFGKHFQHGAKDKTGATLASKEQAWVAENINTKQDALQLLNDKQAERTRQETIINSIDETAEQRNKTFHEGEISRAETEYNHQLDLVTNWIERQENSTTPHADLDAVRAYLQQMTNPGMSPIGTINFTDNAVKSMIRELKSRDNRRQRVHRYHDSRLKTANDHLQQFRDATEAFNILNAEITNLQDEYNNWDDKHKNQYQDLAKYWDMLQEGRISHLGKMWDWHFGNAKDKKLNVNAIQLDFLNRHRYQIAS